jgi:hypothetical protein
MWSSKVSEHCFGKYRQTIYQLKSSGVLWCNCFA